MSLKEKFSISMEDVDTVSLIGKSQRGKNRVREHGALWAVLKVRDKVSFSDKPGPWMLLSSNDNHLLWLNACNDDDFNFDLHM
jgi:hypothetical protein